MPSLSAKQSEAWLYLEDPEVLEVFAGGGAGGGKTYFGCLWQIYRRTTFPGTRGFIGRKDFTSLRDSTMKTYFSVLGELGYRSGEHYVYNGQEHTIYWANGSEQQFRHMSYMPSDPDYNRFGSTEYTDGFVDEAPEVSARACQILLARMRYQHSDKVSPAVLYTGNPGESWVKDQFVMDREGRFIDLPPHRKRVLFTVADNPDAGIREGYAKLLEHLDPYDRARLLHGDWTAKPKAERPFAYMFDHGRHVRHVSHRHMDLVYASLDFNVEPFTGIVGYVFLDKEGEHVHIFDESSLAIGSVIDMCDFLHRSCRGMTHLLQITGDRNGMSRSIGKTGPTKLFNEVAKELGVSSAQIIVPPNPTHKQSRSDVNLVLRDHPDIRIDPRCRRLISDLQMVEVKEDGEIMKADRRHEHQRADHLDAFRYFTNTFLRDWLRRRS